MSRHICSSGRTIFTAFISYHEYNFNGHYLLSLLLLTTSIVVSGDGWLKRSRGNGRPTMSSSLLPFTIQISSVCVFESIKGEAFHFHCQRFFFLFFCCCQSVNWMLSCATVVVAAAAATTAE